MRYFSVLFILCTTSVFGEDTTAAIFGAVVRPGQYKLTSSEGLHDLIIKANGLRDGAAVQEITIKRNEKLYQFDALKIIEAGVDIALANKDTVFIMDSFGGLHGDKLAEYNEAIGQFVKRTPKQLKVIE